MSRFRVPAPLGAAAVLLTLTGVAPASAAWEADYGSRTTVTFGENVHAQMPVTLVLPVPASGGLVTWVSPQWQEPIHQAPPGSPTTTVSRAFDVSHCTTGSACTVTGVLPTAGMANGTVSITFRVSNSDGQVGFFTRQVTVQNPKPTVTFTTPNHGQALWGQVTLRADAAASTDPDAAPLAGVRFHVNGGLAPDGPYLFDDTAPYSVTVSATDIASVLGSRYIVAVAEDTHGNLSVMPQSGSTSAMRRLVYVGPPPVV